MIATKPHTMTKNSLRTEAKWKKAFIVMFNSRPKKQRRTIQQINYIKSLAKLHAAIFHD